MAFTTLTIDDAEQLVLAIIRGSIPDLDTSDRSDAQNLARAIATLFVGNQEQALYLLRQCFPSRAEGDYLALWGQILNADRLPAAKAIGKAAFVATSGTATQSTGSTATTSDAESYTSTADATVALPVFTGKTAGAGSTTTRVVVLPNTTNMNRDELVLINGAVRAIKDVVSGEYAIDLYEPLPAAPSTGDAVAAQRGIVVSIQAAVAGTSGNRSPGDTITLASPASNVTAAGRVCELTGGGAEETTEEQQQRFQALQAFRPGSGNHEFYRALARSTPGARLADAFVFTAARSSGSVDVVPFGVSGSRMLGDSVVAVVAAHMTPKISFADDLRVRSWEYESSVQPVTLVVDPHVGSEPDVPPATALLTAVTGYGPANTLAFAVSPGSVGIQKGDRVCVNVLLSNGLYLLEERVVTSLLAFGVTLDDDLTGDPTSENLYSGGPLTAGIQAAVGSVFDGLGVGGEQDVTALVRHPSSALGFDASLSQATLVKAVAGVTGVRGVVVSAPASTQDPASFKRWRMGRLIITYTA